MWYDEMNHTLGTGQAANPRKHPPSGSSCSSRREQNNIRYLAIAEGLNRQ